MNIIGKATNVANGNRIAEIALGREEDQEFIDLKNAQINLNRMDYAWVSNNSVIVN